MYSPGIGYDTSQLLQFVLALSSVLPLLMVVYCRSRSELQKRTSGRKPHTFPHWIPVIGNAVFVVKLFMNPAGTFSNAVNFLGTSIPVRIRLIFPKYDIYVVAGARNIALLFRHSKDLRWNATSVLGARYCFGLPKTDVDMYLADDSGVSHTPHPESNVDPKYRFWYLVHKSVAEFLSGAGLPPLVERYTDNLKTQVFACQIDDQWTYQSDLNRFMQDEIFRASINATFGPHMLALNPTFVEDFWKYDKCFPSLLKGSPRWLAPTSWRARDKCLQAIRKWSAFVDENHDNYEIDESSQTDPVFGSKFMRVRHKNFKAMDRTSKDHIISANLGFVWAEHANSITAAFWLIFHAVRDASLMARLRREVRSCRIASASEDLAFNVQKLQQQPILGSVWLEVLRLYVATTMSRTPERADFKLGDWTIPMGKHMILSTYDAHRDEEAFKMYTGSDEDFHPLDEFWAERFLLNRGRAHQMQALDPGQEQKEPAPRLKKYDDLDGAYIPFGGGVSICPGRHYAKQKALSSFAILVTAFDFELSLGDGVEVKADLSYYGTGTLRPLGEVPIRLRRRA